MALAYERDSNLAFDSTVLRNAGKKYKAVATNLADTAEELDDALRQLAQSGWTTPAGTAFREMTDTNWSENIRKYVDLLETLDDILNKAADEYDDLMTDYVRVTKVNL